MKKIFASISFAVLATFTTPQVSIAEDIKITVNGMVCSFCAQGIKKKFGKHESIDKIEVALDDHRVSLDLKPDKEISDEEINSIVKSAGYAVEKIERVDE